MQQLDKISIGLYNHNLAGSVIQATGIVEFEDGLWIGNQLKAQNSLQRVCTMPGVLQEAVCTPRFLLEQTEFQSGEFCMAAWRQARCQV